MGICAFRGEWACPPSNAAERLAQTKPAVPVAPPSDHLTADPDDQGVLGSCAGKRAALHDRIAENAWRNVHRKPSELAIRSSSDCRAGESARFAV